jgi:hypothetical protein
VLFHYTTPARAAAIAAKRLLLVSNRPHQRHGHGVFATNVSPGAMPEEDMLVRLFAKQRSAIQVRGVVLLDRSHPDLPFDRVGAGQWIYRASPGESIDIVEPYLGFGVRIGEEWTFSGEVFAAG